MNMKAIGGTLAALLCVGIGFGIARYFAREGAIRAERARGFIEAHAARVAAAIRAGLANIREGAAREALKEKPMRDRPTAEDTKHRVQWPTRLRCVTGRDTPGVMPPRSDSSANGTRYAAPEISGPAKTGGDCRFYMSPGDASAYLILRDAINTGDFEEDAPKGLPLEVCNTRFRQTDRVE